MIMHIDVYPDGKDSFDLHPEKYQKHTKKEKDTIPQYRKSILYGALTGIIIAFLFSIPWTGVPIAVIGVILFGIAVLLFQVPINFFVWMIGYYLILFFIIGLIFYHYDSKRHFF